VNVPHDCHNFPSWEFGHSKPGTIREGTMPPAPWRHTRPATGRRNYCRIFVQRLSNFNEVEMLAIQSIVVNLKSLIKPWSHILMKIILQA